MKESKREQSTFGVTEKDILAILGAFQQEFEKTEREDKRKITRVEYYECIKMEKCEIDGVFITVEQSSDGNISYHLYYQSSQNEICTMDAEGNIKINANWEESVRETDLRKYLNKDNEKQEGLKGISEIKEPREMAQRLEQSKKEEPKEEKEDDKKEEQIQSDIGGQEDLGISYYRQIKDINFGEQMGMNLNGYQEIGLAFSETKNAFILVGKKDGVFQQVEGFELAHPTLKKVISIDEKGENIETEVPHALMETNNSDKELSITIGQYGYIEVGTIDRLPCDERVKRQVGEQGETDSGRMDTHVNNTIEARGKSGLHDWAHDKEMGEDTDNATDVTEEIRRNSDEYIPGTDTRWIDFANRCGYRGDGAIEHAQEIFLQEKGENPEITNKELVEQITEDKEHDSRGARTNRGEG